MCVSKIIKLNIMRNPRKHNLCVSNYPLSSVKGRFSILSRYRIGIVRLYANKTLMSIYLKVYGILNLP